MKLVFTLFLGLLATRAAGQVLGGIAVAPDGSIFVVKNYPDDVVYRVDPQTGAATVVSSDAVGGGPLLLFPDDIAVEAGGSLVVTVPAGNASSLLRVDPSTGDRSVVSDAVTGAGVPLYAPRSVAVGADGALLVSEAADDPAREDRVQRVDAATGDRTIIANPTTGTGPVLGFPTGIAVEPGGDAVVTDLVLDAVVRVDPATGNRTSVADATTGHGPALTRAMAIDAAPDGRLVVAEVPFDPTFCVYLCPSELCGICLIPAPSLVAVDPASGDRTRVSGGGSCLVVSISNCLTPYLGRTGSGPDLFEPTGVAVESPGSYVVADGLGAVVRVNAATGRRRVLTDLGTSAAAVPPGRREGLRRLAAEGGPRAYRPRNPEAWLRSALGDAAWAQALRRSPETFLARLSAAERREVGARLYAALLRTMRTRSRR